MHSTFGGGFDAVSLLFTLASVALVALAVVIGVLLIRTLLWVIRALQSIVRERELRIDLLVAGDDPEGPAPVTPPPAPRG